MEGYEEPELDSVADLERAEDQERAEGELVDPMARELAHRSNRGTTAEDEEWAKEDARRH